MEYEKLLWMQLVHQINQINEENIKMAINSVVKIEIMVNLKFIFSR